MSKVRGIFCLNSKCKYYFEDNCMMILETETVHLSASGSCDDYEEGEYVGYADKSEFVKET